MFLNDYVIKKKFKVIVFVMTCVILGMAVRRVRTWALTNPTSEVNKVVIESDDYDAPGSYRIKKKAKWVSNNTVKVTVDANSIMDLNNNSKDVILVIDDSELMEDKLDVVKSNLKDITSFLLDNEDNRISLITFDSSSEVISNFTKSKADILSEIDSITSKGNTNYYAALNSVLDVLNNYEKSDNTDLIVAFLTTGHPNIDNPNQVGIYNFLKAKYPYIKINGVQFDFGDTIISELSSITDKQIIASNDTLYNALLESIIEPKKYQEFKIEDYIDSSNFTVTSSDINVSMGTFTLNNQKITWDLGNFLTGGNATMTVNLTLKPNLVNTEGLYITNTNEVITSKINDLETVKESDKTLVLKNYHKVSYVTNAPTGCNVSNIEDTNHLIYSNVTKANNLTCNGYIFKGWKLDEDTIKINDNVFKITNKDVTLKGEWSKSVISKDMDGEVYQTANLYSKIASEAINGNEVVTYTGESNDGGDETVYYYTGNVLKNNVVFGDYCFQIVRTTDTGGVKMIYNGPTLNGKCGSRDQISPKIKEKNTVYPITSTLSYGTSFKFNANNLSYELDGNIINSAWNSSTYNNLIGKFVIDDDKLIYIEGYNNSESARVTIYEDGTYPFWIAKTGYSYNDSLAYVGYMYNQVYNTSTRYMTSLNDMILTSIIDDEYYYADSYTYDGNYHLDNEEQLTNNIVGKYTFRNNEANYSNNYLYYVIAVDDNDMYYLQLQNGNTLNDVDTNITFGNSITDNHDGTYTISDTTTIKLSEWYNNYNNLNHKYTCNSNNLTCSNVLYITNTKKTGFDYISVLANFKYGNSFTYDSNTHKYTLTDTVNFYDFKTNYASLNNHHYTCFNVSGECEVISYIPQIDLDNDIFYKIDLSNGESISDAISNMLSSNTNVKDSLIKRYNDIFYKMIDNYSDYLEDTVYCNDRSITSLGGYNPNGGSVQEGITFNNSNSLLCSNNNDKFTVSSEKGNGSLTYPVGFLSKVEANMYGSALNVPVTSLYWLGTPASFNGNTLSVYGVSEGSIVSPSWNSSSTDFLEGEGYTNGMGIRPVISLKPGIEYFKGDGTSDNPYYIALED